MGVYFLCTSQGAHKRVGAGGDERTAADIDAAEEDGNYTGTVRR